MHLVTREETGVQQDMARRRTASPGGLAGWLLECMRTWRAGHGRRPKRQLRVVETLALGAKRQLMLVQCEGERYLVGTGADSIDSIVRVGTESRGRIALHGRTDRC